MPLSGHTPTGIRFIGFIALFFGISAIGNGIAELQNAREFIELVQSQFPQFKGIRPADVRLGGVFALVIGLSISVNVFLNFRLLRWYYFMKGVV
jgi:hypothetical protein